MENERVHAAQSERAPAERAAARPATVLEPHVAEVLALQRSIGNAATVRLLQRREKANPGITEVFSPPALGPGDWTTSDRENNTQRWQDACKHNLLMTNSSQYTEIEQRRDFYRWFYIASVRDRGCETRWALAASIVASGVWDMANLPNSEELAWTMGITSNTIQGMLRRGNQVIFDNVLPKLKDLWLNPRKGEEAIKWDMQTLAEEQTLIQPLYAGASADDLNILQGMATGTWYSAKGGSLIVKSSTVVAGPKIKWGSVPWVTGSLLNTEDRWRYGMKLGKEFSELDPVPGYVIPSTPPVPGTSYSSGAELAKVDRLINLHLFDAITDQNVGRTQRGLRTQATDALKKFAPYEQEYFLNRRTTVGKLKAADVWPRSLIEGMEKWTSDLAKRLELLEDVGLKWWMWNYHELENMIKAAPSVAKRSVRGARWRTAFVGLCNDKSIYDAVRDLEIDEPERTEWINAEL